MTDDGKTKLGWTAPRQPCAVDCCAALKARVIELERQNGDLRYALKKIVSENEGLMLEAHALAGQEPSETTGEAARSIWLRMESATDWARVYGLGMAARVRRLFGKNGETDGPTSDCDGADAGRVRRVPG